MKKILLFIQFIALALSGCSGSDSADSSVTKSDKKEITSAVINRFNAMIKYSEAGELENILMHFDPSGPGTYIDNGVQYSSLDDMLVNYRATWKIQRQDYGIPVTKVYVLSSDFALVTSSSTIVTTLRDGVTFQPRRWSITTLWTRKDDQWLIHSFDQYLGEGVPVEKDEDEDED